MLDTQGEGEGGTRSRRCGSIRSVAMRQNAAVPSGRAFQHNTAGVKRDFQQHTTQHMPRKSQISDQPQSGVVYNFSGTRMYVCNTMTFDSLHVGGSYSLICYASRDIGQVRI